MSVIEGESEADVSRVYSRPPSEPLHHPLLGLGAKNKATQLHHGDECGGGVFVCAAAPVRAQQTAIRTIGWLSLRSADTSTDKTILGAFRQGLSQSGYEGRNLTIEFRFGDGHNES